MKWFKNLKISVKLIITFMIIAALAGSIGVFGIVSLSDTTVQSRNMLEQYGNTQGYLGLVLAELNTQRTLYRDMIIDSDVEMTGKYETSIKASDEEMHRKIEEYGRHCITDEEKAEYSDMVAKIDAFAGVRDGIVAACTAGDYESAYRLLRDQNAIKSLSDATTIVKDTLDSKIEISDIKIIEREASSQATILIMIGLVAAAVILAAGLGIFVSRLISKPIRLLSDAADKLTAGESDIKLEMDTTDEIGRMAKAFSGVVDIVKRMTSDVKALIGAVSEGRFNARTQSAEYSGAYAEIMDGINETVDMFTADFDTLPSPVMAIDKDFNVLYMNETGAKVAGKNKVDIVGTKCYDIFCTSDCGTDNCACMRAMRDKKQTERETDAHPLGMDLQIRYLGTPIIKNGEIVGAFEVVTDLTDVKKAQKEAQNQADALTSLLNEVNIAAEQVAAGTAQVSDGSQAISQGATEQSSAIEELSATITEIAEQTRQNAASANQANELAISARKGATEGNDQMKAMQSAMSEINEASANISKIIKVIDDIAFQTNILALNAAVEAARAGVHGKGFAVVAEEVRNLAARSANAAKETTSLIEGSIKKTEAGTDIANKTASALEIIVEGVEKAAQLTGQIAVASNEQATGITQVNNGIEQLSQVVQTNSATSEETAASAEELSSQAELLKSMVGRFKLKGEANAESAEKMPEPKTRNAESAEAAKPRIVLSDNEFGKY